MLIKSTLDKYGEYTDVKPINSKKRYYCNLLRWRRRECPGGFEKIIGNRFVLPMLFVAHTKLATQLDPFLGYFEN